MKKIIDLHQVDTFTDTLFGGNPAGVVTNADGLDEQDMRAIAREMNLSETAFVLEPTVNGADIKLRYFTPVAEIKFCGHATVGALYQLARINMHGLGGDVESAVKVETNAGVLEMSVTKDSAEQFQVTYVAPGVRMKSYPLQGKAFADAFGISASVLLENGEILLDQELNYMYIPVNSLKQLKDLQFDFTQIRSHFGAEEIVVFCLYTNGTIKSDSHLHARGLAPLVGVDEDPFTGSMQAGLVHASKQNALLQADQQRIMVEQGYFIDRPGFAEINHKNNELCVTASAVSVFSTKMELDV